MGMFDELPLPSDKAVSFTLFLLRFLFMIRLVAFLTERFSASGSILRSFGRSCVCCSKMPITVVQVVGKFHLFGLVPEFSLNKITVFYDKSLHYKGRRKRSFCMYSIYFSGF